MKILCSTLLLASLCGPALGQSSARFAITRGVMACGGATSSASARFRLASTVGQPLAAEPGSARYSLQGGFWIVPSPVLFGPEIFGGNFLALIQSELGKTYTLQYADALGSPWQSLPPVTGNGNIITVTNSAVGVAGRFYRLLER